MEISDNFRARNIPVTLFHERFPCMVKYLKLCRSQNNLLLGAQGFGFVLDEQFEGSASAIMG